jgi:hypothetical protein
VRLALANKQWLKSSNKNYWPESRGGLKKPDAGNGQTKQKINVRDFTNDHASNLRASGSVPGCFFVWPILNDPMAAH